MKILVVGGTGMLGEPVARQLLADGHSVRILSRRPEAARARFADPFEVAGGDVEDADALARAVAGCDGVHISLDGHGDWDLERRGASAVSAAAAAAGSKRITLISGASVCEDNAWFPMTRAKLGAETAVRACGVPYTILRCTMFMETLPKMVKGDKALVMGKQVHPWHFVSAGDYARMASRAFTTDEAEDQILFVFGPQALTLEQAMETYRRLCAPHAKLTRVPFAMLGIMALLPGRAELRRVGLPVMKYFARVPERGSPEQANRLLGAPETTLQRWCEAVRAESRAVSDQASDGIGAT